MQIVAGRRGDAPRGALDEFEIAQRNSARSIGLTITAQVGSPDAVAELREHADLMTPRVVALGKSVQQYDRRPKGFQLAAKVVW